MSQANALAEIRRFLSTNTPEVLSISGRWGVGKTHAWDEAVRAAGAALPLPRYAYVSVFGLRSLDLLKTAIFQSTIRAGSPELEPSVQSFYENLSKVEGLSNLAEIGGRKGLNLLNRAVSAIPYAGKAADLLAPGAALLIRNQIVCIDDIERAGKGLDIADILGLVSSFKERRRCKVVLLLNEEGLGKQEKTYRSYLEKVVDQAIRFDPTPAESAAVAFAAGDMLAAALGARTISLGITNIRVIRRVRRFLEHLEPHLADLHPDTTDRVIMSIALLGWCVFERPKVPVMARLRRYRHFTGLFSNAKRTDEELRTDAFLKDYGFAEFEDVDQVILDGLKAGAFDEEAFRQAADQIDAKLARNEVRLGIARPWMILGDSFDEDMDGFVAALVQSIELHAAGMDPLEATDVLTTLRELDRGGEADRLLPIYVDAQAHRPREFFSASHQSSRRPLDPAIRTAFDERLAAIPLERDPGELLLEIARKDGWSPEDVSFLASVPAAEYRSVLKRLRGRDLQAAISAARRFGDFKDTGRDGKAVAARMNEALRMVAGEGPLNASRVHPYLQEADPTVEVAAGGDDIAEGGPADAAAVP